MSRRARTSAAPAEPLYGRGGDGLALQFLVLDGFSQKKIFENKLLVAGREWSAANAARYVAVRGFQTSFGLDDLIKRTAIWTGEISRRFGHNSDAPNSLSHAYQYQERPLSSILACKLPVLRFAQQPRQLRLDDLTVTKFESSPLAAACRYAGRLPAGRVSMSKPRAFRSTNALFFGGAPTQSEKKGGSVLRRGGAWISIREHRIQQRNLQTLATGAGSAATYSTES